METNVRTDPVVAIAGVTGAVGAEFIATMDRRGFRVALAGGLGPDNIDSVLAFEPEIVIVGSGITESGDPKEVAKWMRNKLINPGRGWPWEKK